MDPLTFTAELWLWEAKQPATVWTFVTVPEEYAEEITMRGGPRKGFGSVRVEVTVDDLTWRTSVFPDAERGYVLPIKAAVRRHTGVEAGDPLDVALRVIGT